MTAPGVAAEYRPGDLVWVHDYQLLRLPALLRERLPNARVGFFLHLPFPDADAFAALPRVLPGRCARPDLFRPVMPDSLDRPPAAPAPARP